MTTLSGAGQTYALPTHQQEVMCLLSDMTLVVRSGEERSADVLSYVDLIRRKGARIARQVPTTVTVIREMYEVLAHKERSFVLDNGSSSAQQIDVVRLIQEAVKRGASDIHLNMWGRFGGIFFRINGDLYKVQEPPTEKIKGLCSTIYMSMCDIADSTYRPDAFQDARLHGDFVARCGLYGSRIASGPTVYGPRMVIRLLYDPGRKVPSLEELGYLSEQIEMFEMMRRQTSGINILSGATGSGKSTTLVSNMSAIISAAKAEGAAFVDLQEEGGEEYVGVSVVTIEDPPEYDIEGAVRIPLKADKTDEESIRRGWANAIKACMRQDPDIMMIGEIRDPGSAKAAFDAAMTGHGVWTTVHVTDAVGIMPRLEGLEVEKDRMLDPEIITGLINQTLVQKLCPDCSYSWDEGKHMVSADLQARVNAYCEVDHVRLRRRGHNCPTCGGAGIVGRMVIAEVITPDLPFMEEFSAHGKAKAKAYWVRKMGGITKCMAAIRRINEGWVDPRQAEAVVSPLDKDKRTMGIDYSKAGDFEQGKDNVRPRDFAQRKSST